MAKSDYQPPYLGEGGGGANFVNARILKSFTRHQLFQCERRVVCHFELSLLSVLYCKVFHCTVHAVFMNNGLLFSVGSADQCTHVPISLNTGL